MPPLTSLVPNVPCGVERPDLSFLRKGDRVFLMYRVELKVLNKATDKKSVLGS